MQNIVKVRTPETTNGLIQMIRMDQSTCHKKVNLSGNQQNFPDGVY